MSLFDSGGRCLPARSVAGSTATATLAPLLVLGLTLSSPAIASAPPRPNIVLILADDMGYSDLGCFGSEIRTPNIDGLAERGVRFTQFYNGARCNPSRASLLTGLYPHQTGMGWVGDRLGLPSYLGYLNDQCVTIAEVLRPAGYATYMSGKWHLGSRESEKPVDRGFDRYFGLLDGAGSYWEVLPGAGFQMGLDRGPWKPGPDERNYYITDAITDRAMEFLDQNGQTRKPFFLYLAYTAPHWPLHAFPEDIARYRGKYLQGWDAVREGRHRRQCTLGIVDPRWKLSPRDPSVPSWESLSASERDRWDLRMAVYAAMVDRMDQNIGRLLAKLEALRVRDNTLVLFLSDNGGCSIDPAPTTGGSSPDIPPGPRGGYWGYGPPWANVSNTPFRKFKQSNHEGGIATPLICEWPAGIVQPGRINRQPGHLMDIMATLVDLTGAVYPQEFHGRPIHPLEGLSFAPVFNGERRREHAFLVFQHTGNRAVRAGDWKIVASGDSARWELYNLSTDRTELQDRAAERPEKVAELAREYDRRAREWGVISMEEAMRRRKARR